MSRHSDLFTRLASYDLADFQELTPRELARRDALQDELLLDTRVPRLTVALRSGASLMRRVASLPGRRARRGRRWLPG